MLLLYRKIKLIAFFVLLSFIVTIFSSGFCIASEIADDVCLECHDIEISLQKTEHKLGRLPSNGMEAITCISCHPDAEQHIDDPSTENINNPATMDFTLVLTLCENCHIGHNVSSNFGYSSHSANDISCVECHTVHETEEAKLIQNKTDNCIKCHESIISDLNARSHHPLTEGNIECLDCHTEFSKENLDQDYANNISCKKCHVKQTNAHLYEHEVVMNYSVEGNGCVSCHTSHGSESTYLLSQPSNQLCQQCHFPAGHMTAHGGTYADQECMTCHSDIHGSNLNKNFLNKTMPLLYGSNCYNNGCHKLIE